MDEILVQLNRVRGVGGSLLCSADGLPIATALREGADEARLAAAVASLVEQGVRLANALGLGDVAATSATADQGGIILLRTGSAYLAILVDPAANQALLQIETKPFVERLAQRLSL
jgi:predicted regulator of Ras-like GTPase activity (Roadblock/LC7/MglB family)